MKLNHCHNILTDILPLALLWQLQTKLCKALDIFQSDFFLQLYNQWKGYDVFIDKIISHIPTALTFISANEYLHIYVLKYCHAYAWL
jgi:hypothetical protein